MDTGCLISPEPNLISNNTVAATDVSSSKASEYTGFKGARHIKDLSFSPITLDIPSSLTPLNTPRAHLLSGLRTAPCLERQTEHEFGSKRNEKTSVPLQNIYKKDAVDMKSYKVPSYPHTATLSSKTARGLGLPVHKQITIPQNSISEPSTPYQCYFDESERIAQEKYPQFLFDNSSFTQYAPSQHLYMQKQMKNMTSTSFNAPAKGIFPYNTLEQLRKQAINKILHAGIQRQNNLLPLDSSVLKEHLSNSFI
ncbi:hypothetical protein PORY_002813 [Pneumocystis oryctolagi]|uniref:Uncharacterized protein n=1 Tax=Pneumocystis oryctolagi TaxID=42067 RepID=A0ACB7CA73_9ASCO|nr:hypothetical protein PORY_002813 [Pneumocystis oryctolagi]